MEDVVGGKRAAIASAIRHRMAVENWIYSSRSPPSSLDSCASIDLVASALARCEDDRSTD